MKDILNDLYNYILELTPAIRDPDYEQALQAYTEIEGEVKEKIGETLLYKYQCAEADVSHRQNIAVFGQALRFSHGLMLELLR